MLVAEQTMQLVCSRKRRTKEEREGHVWISPLHILVRPKKRKECKAEPYLTTDRTVLEWNVTRKKLEARSSSWPPIQCKMGLFDSAIESDALKRGTG